MSGEMTFLIEEVPGTVLGALPLGIGAMTEETLSDELLASLPGIPRIEFEMRGWQPPKMSPFIKRAMLYWLADTLRRAREMCN